MVNFEIKLVFFFININIVYLILLKMKLFYIINIISFLLKRYFYNQ